VWRRNPAVKGCRGGRKKSPNIVVKNDQKALSADRSKSRFQPENTQVKISWAGGGGGEVISFFVGKKSSSSWFRGKRGERGKARGEGEAFLKKRFEEGVRPCGLGTGPSKRRGEKGIGLATKGEVYIKSPTKKRCRAGWGKKCSFPHGITVADSQHKVEP